MPRWRLFLRALDAVLFMKKSNQEIFEYNTCGHWAKFEKNRKFRDCMLLWSVKTQFGTHSLFIETDSAKKNPFGKPQAEVDFACVYNL